MNSGKLPADVELLFRTYGKYISFLKRHPTHATRAVFGIFIPPHESVLLENAFMGYTDNVFVCSRGTSKTFTIGSLFPVINGLVKSNVNTLVASASRFRGGKMVLKDSARLVKGTLKNQRIKNKWAVKSLEHPSLLRREPDMWSMEFRSNSMLFTIPTNNEEAVRGVRTNVMVIDERNTFDEQAIQIVFKPFLNVGGDFENPAIGSEGNQSFAIGTIDYTYRPWYKTIEAAQDILQLQHKVHQALMSGDWATYDMLMTRKGRSKIGTSVSFLRFDYTDLLIPTTIENYKIHYPGAVAEKTVRTDLRDDKEYIYTYPVNKRAIEDPLDQGIVDREQWAAENRNQFIHASGTLYSPAMVEKATGPIYSDSEAAKRGWSTQERGTSYVPPVLWSCTDPCVLGVDTARTSDFSAFVVIRVGNAPNYLFNSKASSYNLSTHSGPSSWANVVWVEQHQNMTIAETVQKIHELRARYNLIYTKISSGIIMDARGGGTLVRDELAEPRPSIGQDGMPEPLWKAPQRIFDPEDEEYGDQLLGDPDAWPGLKLLWTTDLINQELVSFSRAQFDSGRLYLCRYLNMFERDDPERKLSLGYLGAQALKSQLLRIQAVATPAGKSVRYMMPQSNSDKNSLENKKDTFMAFLYACYGLRQLVLMEKDNRRAEPVAYGEVIRLGGRFYK